MKLTELEIRSYLEREEDFYLELKSLWDQSDAAREVCERRTVRDEIARQVAAFANAEGGVLILGVEDDGTPSGHGYPEEAVEEFARVPRTRIEPELSVDLQRFNVDGHELLVFDVPRSLEAVMVKGDGFPLRVQDTVRAESQERINAFKQAARAVPHEEIVRPDASLEDLDLALARQVLAWTPAASRDVEEALERYGLIHRLPRESRITNGALLLFGRDPIRWHPHAGVRLFRVAGTERSHGSRRNVSQLPRVDLPLARLVPEVHKQCGAQIRKSEKLHDLFFREHPEYPTFAWQEAIVNAVAHRDYSERGRGIEVWFFDDRMEVASPGTLLPPITIEDLRSRRGVHLSRNPLLVRVLVEAGLMREEGEGIPRMLGEMEASFLEAPQFEEFAGLFRVTLRNTPILDAGNPEWQVIVGKLPITTAQKRVLVANPGGFTSGDYQKLNVVDRDQSYREIQELVAQGIIEASGGRGRGARYRVSPDLIRSRVWLEERVPALRSFFATSSKLTNAKYRELVGVERHRAREELARLRDAAVLEQRGAKRGAHYVPGPALDRTRG